jgi:hypothetical protein
MQYLLSALGATAAIVLLLVFPRRLATTQKFESQPEELPSLSIVGGAIWLTTWWPIGATWPLARLDVYSWGLRIGPRFRWLNWVLPTTELRWNQILRAKLSLFGIRLKWHSSPSRWILFGGGYGPFPGIDPRVAAALQEAGVEVES